MRDDLRDDPMPYGVNTIRLRISFPAAPAPQDYDDRVWWMRPLRGWTGGQADDGAAIPIVDHAPAASGGYGGAAPNDPPPLDPNRPFVVDQRYDDARRRVRATTPHYGRADAPVPAMPEGNYQPGLAFLMQRIAGARPEDLPQLYADIRALYMQPGAHRTGEALIRAVGDAAEAGSDLRTRLEILNSIAPVAKSDPLQLAADEFGLPGAVLSGVGAGAEALAAREGAAANLGKAAEGAEASLSTEARLQAIQKTKSLYKLRDDLGTEWFDEQGKLRWPSDDGAFRGWQATTLQPGTTIDRYGLESGFISLRLERRLKHEPWHLMPR